MLLVTVAGITPVDRGEWKYNWYWSLTESALAQLLLNPSIQGIFNVKIGNVFAAVRFLQGLGYQRVLHDVLDPAFPVVIGIVKRQHQ